MSTSPSQQVKDDASCTATVPQMESRAGADPAAGQEPFTKAAQAMCYNCAYKQNKAWLGHIVKHRESVEAAYSG